jgi:hypothetical protein
MPSQLELPKPAFTVIFRVWTKETVSQVAAWAEKIELQQVDKDMGRYIILQSVSVGGEE